MSLGESRRGEGLRRGIGGIGGRGHGGLDSKPSWNLTPNCKGGSGLADKVTSNLHDFTRLHK